MRATARASSWSRSDGRQLRRADLLVALGRALIRLEKMLEAWDVGRGFDLYAVKTPGKGGL